MRWAIHVLRDAAWAPIAVLITHVVLSKGFDAYDHFPHLDVPVHLACGVAIAYFLHTASRLGSAYGMLGGFHALTHCLLVIGWTSVAAMIWEFAEFLSDRYFGTRMQGNDLNDTLLDVLMGMLGGGVFLMFVGAFFGFSAQREH